MYYHINAIGLLWVPGIPDHRMIDNIILRPPHVVSSSSENVYQLQPGNILGRFRTKTPYKNFLGICRSANTGIARNHLKVVAIDDKDTIDPSVVLQVYSGRLPDNNLLLSVIPYGEPSTSIRTINEGCKTTVAIGDTLKLTTRLSFDKESYFVVVGLLVPPVDMKPFAHEEM